MPMKIDQMWPTHAADEEPPRGKAARSGILFPIPTDVAPSRFEVTVTDSLDSQQSNAPDQMTATDLSTHPHLPPPRVVR